MKKKQASSIDLLPPPVSYDALLATFSQKERQSYERQITSFETRGLPWLAKLWQRLSCLLIALAPKQAKLTGLNTLQFFVPDGKYRRQTFALNTADDGSTSIYAPDMLPQALKAKIVSKAGVVDTHETYKIVDSGETLVIDSLDKNSLNPQAFFKDMTGWNRKAICIILPPSPTEGQIKAAEKLCMLAAVDWAVALVAPAVAG